MFLINQLFQLDLHKKNNLKWFKKQNKKKLQPLMQRVRQINKVSKVKRCKEISKITEMELQFLTEIKSNKKYRQLLKIMVMESLCLMDIGILKKKSKKSQIKLNRNKLSK